MFVSKELPMDNTFLGDYFAKVFGRIFWRLVCFYLGKFLWTCVRGTRQWWGGRPRWGSPGSSWWWSACSCGERSWSRNRNGNRKSSIASISRTKSKIMTKYTKRNKFWAWTLTYLGWPRGWLGCFRQKQDRLAAPPPLAERGPGFEGRKGNKWFHYQNPVLKVK